MQHNTEHSVGQGDIQEDSTCTLGTHRGGDIKGEEERSITVSQTTHFFCLFEERNCVGSASRVASSSSGLSDVSTTCFR